MDQQLFCWLLFSTENGEIKNLDFDHPSLDVWGIGPGFEETATTFSVCSWLFIYYVVCIVKTIFEIISWFVVWRWWDKLMKTKTSLRHNKKNTFFCRENQILCGLIVYHAMERLPSAAHSVRFIQNSKFWRKKWCHEILFLGFSMHFKKIIWIDDKPFLQKWWVSQRLSSQSMNTPGNQR